MPRGRNFFDEVASATGTGAVYFYLPLPPSLYQVQEPAGGHTATIGDEHRVYRRRVADIVAMDFARSSPFEGYVEVRILLRFHSFRRIDIDNHIKPLIDALTHAGVWKDDSQLHSVSIVRETFDGDEHCVVEVAECSSISRGITALADLMHGDGVLDEYLTGPEGAV
jgi:crossover junction endodeoxyribonuclease RusA